MRLKKTTETTTPHGAGSIKPRPKDSLRAIGGINSLDYSGLLCLFLGYSETWDTLLTLRGTKVIYMDYVGTLGPSKSYLWVGRVVAHKILETAQSPDLGLRLRLVINVLLEHG